jgi:hypothetical protein
MERRRAGQGAGERGLEGVPEWMTKHIPTFTRAIAKTDPERRSWIVGERGEQKAGKVLDKLAARVGGEIVYDVQLDGENIDVVAVLPTGIFIVEVKAWTGRVNLKGDVMFHGGRQPRRVHAQVERQKRKLVEQLGLTYPVEGVIVFIPHADLEIKGKRDPESTPIWFLHALPEFLMGTRRSPRPVVLQDWEIGGIATTIRTGHSIVIKP